MTTLVTRLLRGSLLLVAVMAVVSSASAQDKLLLTFPDVPCDSTMCDSIAVVNSDTSARWIVGISMRDGIDYSVSPQLTLPDTILPGTARTLGVCFQPSRRGTISDSLFIVLGSDGGVDTLKVRLTGRGIGPSLEVIPSVLNFPKTNPGGAVPLSLVIHNNGERSFTLVPGALNVPAPFRLLTTLPLDIPPGDSVVLDFLYEPTEKGVFSASVPIAAGCSVGVQIDLNGATDLVGTGAVLRSSKLGFNAANVEQVPCDVSRCTYVTLSNIGNAPLLVESLEWALGTEGYTIVSPPSTPLVIPDNGQQTLQVCLSSTRRGTLRDTLIIRSNTRTSIAFGLVIDVSNSMKTTMDCGTSRPTRLEQARVQSVNFLEKTLLYLPSVGIQDQIAISRYSGSASVPFVDHFFPLTFTTDASRQAAETAVNTTITNTISGTQTGAAIISMIDTLKKSPYSNRVLVLVTDGLANDTITNSVTVLKNMARANNVRIFTIGLGLSAFADPKQRAAATEYLTELANGTQGSAYLVEDCSTLQGAFEAITDSVSRGNIIREPFAIRVTAPLLVADHGIRFDSVYYHRSGRADTVCSSITLTNVGEGDAVLDAIAFADQIGASTDEFMLPDGVTLPITIPESGQIDIPVCFTPKGLRERAGNISFDYNGCGVPPVQKDLAGTGYARANLRVSDERAGLPGTIVTMPIYSDTSLAGFEVKSFTYALRWNKTMLDLRRVVKGSMTGTAAVDITSPLAFNGRYAEIGITVTGDDALIAPGEIAELEFQVLRGDTLASLIEITSGTFEDGNPQTIIDNAGLIAYDSTCFRSYKPLQTGSAAARIVVGDVSPNPAVGGSISVMVESSAATTVGVEIYSGDGSLVRPASERSLEEGVNTLDFDLLGVAAGSYYLVVRTPTGDSVFRKIVTVK